MRGEPARRTIDDIDGAKIDEPTDIFERHANREIGKAVIIEVALGYAGATPSQRAKMVRAAVCIALWCMIARILAAIIILLCYQG